MRRLSGQQTLLRRDQRTAEAEQLIVGQVLPGQLGLDRPLLGDALGLAIGDARHAVRARDHELVTDLDPVADQADGALIRAQRREDEPLPDGPRGEGVLALLVSGEDEGGREAVVLARPIDGLEGRPEQPQDEGDDHAVAPAGGDEPTGGVRLGHAPAEGGNDGDADGDDDQDNRDGVTHGVFPSCTSVEDGRLFVNLCHIDPMAVDTTH